MVRGVEFNMGWRFKLDANTPKPLTGYNILIQIRPYSASTTIIKAWTESSPEVVFTPLTGAIDLNLKPTTTLSFDFKQAVIDCWIYNGTTDTDGDRSSTWTINLEHGVSRL